MWKLTAAILFLVLVASCVFASGVRLDDGEVEITLQSLTGLSKQSAHDPTAWVAPDPDFIVDVSYNKKVLFSTEAEQVDLEDIKRKSFLTNNDAAGRPRLYGVKKQFIVYDAHKDGYGSDADIEWKNFKKSFPSQLSGTTKDHTRCLYTGFGESGLVFKLYDEVFKTKHLLGTAIVEFEKFHETCPPAGKLMRYQVPIRNKSNPLKIVGVLNFSLLYKYKGTGELVHWDKSAEKEFIAKEKEKKEKVTDKEDWKKGASSSYLTGITEYNAYKGSVAFPVSPQVPWFRVKIVTDGLGSEKSGSTIKVNGPLAVGINIEIAKAQIDILLFGSITLESSAYPNAGKLIKSWIGTTLAEEGILKYVEKESFKAVDEIDRMGQHYKDAQAKILDEQNKLRKEWVIIEKSALRAIEEQRRVFKTLSKDGDHSALMKLMRTHLEGPLNEVHFQSFIRKYMLVILDDMREAYGKDSHDIFDADRDHDTDFINSVKETIVGGVVGAISSMKSSSDWDNVPEDYEQAQLDTLKAKIETMNHHLVSKDGLGEKYGKALNSYFKKIMLHNIAKQFAVMSAAGKVAGDKKIKEDQLLTVQFGAQVGNSGATVNVYLPAFCHSREVYGGNAAKTKAESSKSMTKFAGGDFKIALKMPDKLRDKLKLPDMSLTFAGTYKQFMKHPKNHDREIKLSLEFEYPVSKTGLDNLKSHLKSKIISKASTLAAEFYKGMGLVENYFKDRTNSVKTAMNGIVKNAGKIFVEDAIGNAVKGIREDTIKIYAPSTFSLGTEYYVGINAEVTWVFAKDNSYKRSISVKGFGKEKVTAGDSAFVKGLAAAAKVSVELEADSGWQVELFARS